MGGGVAVTPLKALHEMEVPHTNSTPNRDIFLTIYEVVGEAQGTWEKPQGRNANNFQDGHCSCRVDNVGIREKTWAF
jgi:hypothetical protein